MNDCHACRYHLEGEGNPYARCLIFYNKGVAPERLKKGLIGECDEFKPINDYSEAKTMTNDKSAVEWGEGYLKKHRNNTSVRMVEPYAVIRALVAELKEAKQDASYQTDMACQCDVMLSKRLDELTTITAERDALEKEVGVLRQYGNKDCTAMADEVLANEQ